MDWAPIITIPLNEAVELAKFPAPIGEEPKPWFGFVMVSGDEAKRLDALNGATHWRRRIEK